MTPFRLGVLLAAALAVLATATVTIDSDIRGLIGDGDVVGALDTLQGRSVMMAVVHPDRDKRSQLAAVLAEELTNDPMVERVLSRASAPHAVLVDWLWEHRLALAPPTAEAFATDAMAAEMVRARDMLTSPAKSHFADSYMLDPTGSFRRLVDAIMAAAAPRLANHRGIPQAHDDSAAILALELRNAPFDVERQRAFDRRLSDRIEAQGAEVLIVGPRPVAATVSERIATRATGAGAIGGALLLGWMILMLRSGGAIAMALLPVSIGFAIASLAVQTVYGGLHVIVLGFGGALLGIALDYPIHMIAHGGNTEGRVRAKRCIALGAATTSVAFLSLLGAGVPVLGQVGLFVATGLAAAAVASLLLLRKPPALRLRWQPALGRIPRTRWKLPVCTMLAAAAAVSLWLKPAADEASLVRLPPEIVEAVRTLDGMVGLPSGQYRFEVVGKTLAEIVARQLRLREAIEQARSEGWVGQAEMISNYLPPAGSEAKLPGSAQIKPAVQAAAADAGFARSMVQSILEAYEAARDLPSPGPKALAPISEELTESGLLMVANGSIVAPVKLWDVVAPGRLTSIAAGMPGVRFVDERAHASKALNALKAGLLPWLGVGALAGLLLISAVLRKLTTIADIVVSCLAAVLLAAVVSALLVGSLGLFQLVALALVAGLGIDYGLIQGADERDAAYGESTRSVLLCAVTTLTAFAVMALSGVALLEAIGLTVTIGVLFMVIATAIRPKRVVGDGR